MANLEKIIKVTQEQYDILASGGKVGDYVGLQDNYVYMIEDTNEYITTAGGTINGPLTIATNETPLTLHYNNDAEYFLRLYPNPTDNTKIYSIDVENYAAGEVTLSLPSKSGTLVITDDIPKALKNPFLLKFGAKTYDGSSAQTITLADLGGQAAGNYAILDSNGKLAESVMPANYLPLSGGTMTGNLAFSPVSSTSYPASSNYISWSGSTDGAAIYYRVDASDTGRLVFQTADDSNCNFVWHNTVSGNGDVMTLTGNGNLTVKGDITSNGNKVALDKDVVKLTGDQTISGTKTFTNKISDTYLTGGILDTHPESGGTIISYYTNDLGYLFERGGSCVATIKTQNNKTLTVPADVFDCSPSYWYLSLNSTSDVVQILVKTPQTYTYGTRGGIGFGANAWRAKDVKIEVGYSAANTGNASSPDTDIHWVTKINLTGQGEGLVFGNINGPTEAEGGNSSNSWSYMRLTLTNWATVNPRIAQIFSVTYNSRGLHNTFLSKNGGYVYGNILPSNNNRYLGNGSENWAAVYARFFYENGTSLADKYLGINGTAKTANYLLSPTTSGLEDANISDKENTNKAKLRIDLATSATTSNKPSNDGFIYTNVWDINNSKNNNSQLYIPNGYHITNGRRLSVRGCKDDTWQTSWKELAYYSDLDNYTKKTIMVPDNTSLDTVTESGFYRLSMNHKFPHAQMIVSRGADTIAQMAFPYDTTRMYVRTGNPLSGNGNGAWRDWKQVAFTDHTHTSINTAFVFNNNDMPEAEGSATSANLAGTTKAHQISFYRNGLSIPYQMDDSNDGGILRCRGNSESNTIFELATWDDYGEGETIQFNYYPTNSQATPTYSVTVPKKTGTIILNTDSSSAGNAAADKVVVRNDAGSIQTEKLAVSSGTTTKATMQYNSTEDCIEFIFA